MEEDDSSSDDEDESLESESEGESDDLELPVSLTEGASAEMRLVWPLLSLLSSFILLVGFRFEPLWDRECCWLDLGAVDRWTFNAGMEPSQCTERGVDTTLVEFVDTRAS